MEKLRRKNCSEISQCIISQVRYELRLKNQKPKNIKKCSNQYWNEVVDIVAKLNSIDKEKYKAILR